MGLGYQIADQLVIDYQLWFIERGIPGLRGPRQFFGESNYLAFSGAAQTLGRFVRDPFPSQVGRFSNMPFLNLGISGAGPEYYLGKPTLINVIGEAAIHICQVLSARSVSAGIFQCQNNNAVLKFLSGPREGEKMLAANAYSVLRKEYGENAYKEQIAAVQDRWIELYLELLSITNTTTYIVWISTEKIGQVGEKAGEGSAVGEFPHFVTREMVEKIASACRGIIDCTFESMRPQPLINEITGELCDVWDRENFPQRPDNIRAFNVYYPTPEQHDLTAARIIRTLVTDELC